MPEIPSQIGKYAVISRLGSGGMGTVYLGRDVELDRPVAIKVLRDEIHDDEALQRFFREARAAAALRHPNIITIYTTGQHDHQPFIAMEFVDGVPLTEVIRHRRPLTLSDKLSYIDQICAGLHFAHRAGIIHRDIKPANLMADREGVIRILDFGIARIEGSGMTRDGMMMGTLNYMSPEQMLGRPVDHRSDIFAVGAVAYELLCDHQAFKGGLNDGLLQRLPNEDPPRLTDLCAGLPEALVQVVMRALQKAPDKRFADLGEMRAALVDVRRHIEVAASQETVMVRPGAAPRAPSNRTAAPTPTSTATLDALGLLTQPRENKDLTVRQCVADAHVQLEKGNSVRAMRLLQQAVAIDPDNRVATEMLSRVQAATRQAAGAGTAAHGVVAPRPEAGAPPMRATSSKTILVLAGGAIVAVLAIAAVPWLNRGDGSATSPTAEAISSPNVTRPDGADTTSAGPASAAPQDASTLRTGSAPTAVPPARSVAGAAVASKATTPTSAAVPTIPVTQPSDVKPGAAPAALSNAPAVAPAATPAAAETAAPDSGIQDLLPRVRSMYTSGDLAGALDLLAQNPGVSNDSAVKDVSARIANAAFDSMNSSEKDARARNAADLAGEALRVANDAKSRAESARQRSALVDAGIQALLARDAYQQAAVQALARRQPAVIPASAATAPPHDALESERAGIVATLGRFQAAYRDRDMNALLQVFPSLQREARQALERAFRDCRAYDVGFGEMELLLNPADATAAQVTVPTTYSCTVRTGQRPQVAAQRDVFVLRKRGGTWIIERTGSVN